MTVVLGFSLLFLRFWSFEAPGHWSALAVVAALLLSVSIVLQFVALWRALRIEDDDETEYRTTLRWFLFAVIVLFISVSLAALVHTGLI